MVSAQALSAAFSRTRIPQAVLQGLALVLAPSSAAGATFSPQHYKDQTGIDLDLSLLRHGEPSLTRPRYRAVAGEHDAVLQQPTTLLYGASTVLFSDLRWFSSSNLKLIPSVDSTVAQKSLLLTPLLLATKNYAAAGFKDPAAMLTACASSDAAFLAWVTFIVKNKFHTALAGRDYEGFVSAYSALNTYPDVPVDWSFLTRQLTLIKG